MLEKIKRYQFLFTELVKRDFTKKYKRTMLGMAWSILSPLMTLMIMWVVFSNFFGGNMKHYVVYLFSGQLVFAYFTDSTNLSMNALVNNAGIFTKVNVPKYLFLLSQNVSSLINFGLTLLLFFGFAAIDGVTFTWKFVCLLYPITCLVAFNIGMGMILSALYVFFRDMQYLWGVITQLLMWMSAIFYTIEGFSYKIQMAFLANPVYLYIRYFRKIVLDGVIPSPGFHLLAAAYALIALAIGTYVYRKYNHEFLYYV
ncbi:MAG TPA: ABC transporter permease [Clostridia bacterium]|nr:ABC transporter permease [Clostridia bacterium]